MMHSIYRRFNKSSLLLYLFFLKVFPAKKINESDGAILVLADLFFGDLAMAGPLIIELKKQNPSRKIILLSKFSLTEVANLFDISFVVGADYLNWQILSELRKASPEGYGKVINIFSWKWLSLLKALPNGKVISHLGSKSRSNMMVTEIVSISDKPIVASQIILDLLPKSQKNIKKIRFKLTHNSREYDYLNNYLIIHIGASSNAKLWPLDLIEFLLKLSLKLKKTIVFSGLDQEYGYQLDLIKLINLYMSRLKIINLIGQTNIVELLELVSNAKGIISVDTGIVHWARLLSVPNLSVTGPADIKLYGGNKSFFENSRSVSAESLDCQDKNTFHGVKIRWMSSCTRSECPLPSRLCFDGVNRQEIEKDFFELFS